MEVDIDQWLVDQGFTPGANLGLATTREILAELSARMRISQNSIKGRELGRLCDEAQACLDPGVLSYRVVNDSR